MIRELPHVWPWFLEQMYFKNSNRKFRPRWGWGELHVSESSVLSDAIDTSCPWTKASWQTLSPCPEALVQGRGAADKTQWVSGQLLNEADS